MRIRRVKNEMNVVPYIDVMLVLLVIFMITAPLINYGEIEIPSVGNSSEKSENPVEIQLLSNKQINVIDHQTQQTISNLNQTELLNRIRQIEKNRNIILSGDKKLSYGDVINVLDEIKKNGYKNIGLLVRQDEVM